MSFKCPECHDDECPGFELQSHGRCESCGKVDSTYDCHYVSPEKQVEIDRKMRDLGFVPDPSRPGRYVETNR